MVLSGAHRGGLRIEREVDNHRSVGRNVPHGRKSCVVAGNIGQPFSGYVEETVPDGVAVLEISSFQLETIRDFHPEVAVFLNLTPDHIDRHGSLENYGRVKSRIFENQKASDCVVFNSTDVRVSELVRAAKSRRIGFGMEETPGLCGFVSGGNLTLRLETENEELLPVSEMGIRGEHNVANGLAAALAARLMSVGVVPLRKALRTFRGLPHRMEFVREMDGVKWVNDSKATNVDSVWYALGAYTEPVVLIAGGRDKDSDFAALRERLREKVKTAVLLGEAAEKMEKAFRGVCPLMLVASLEEAVATAQEVAEPGDVVLLSPACASFDMFLNFEDRGERFKALVGRL